MKKAFLKSIPIMCSYLFVSMAYGIMMKEAGFAWYDAVFISVFVYTGAFQFVLISLLTESTPLFTIAVTALIMNSRQSFYSLAFVKDFLKMGKRKLYMIHTMTDETYAVNCSLDMPEKEKLNVMFWIAIFSQGYWLLGAAAGGLLGAVIPIQLEGIDFCMTALFITILIDQWEMNKNYRPVLIGLGAGVICFLIFGADYFMLPALLIASGILLVEKEADA